MSDDLAEIRAALARIEEAIEILLSKQPTQYMSTKIAAERCGLSERTIHKALADGRLKVVRVGRRVLIKPEDLEEFMGIGGEDE